MKSSKDQLRSRGYIEDHEITPYQEMPTSAVLELLDSSTPRERTIAATIFGLKKESEAVPALIMRLKVEKKLYCKIAVSEALCTIGAPATASLIDLLGEIGKNQHDSLPSKPFGKKNYPLPRDIAARTLCGIGMDAYTELLNRIDTLNRKQLLEALDAIGFIAFYADRQLEGDFLLDYAVRYAEDPVVMWKILRCMQSYFDQKIVVFLKNVADNSDIESHRWEARRSLEQIERRAE